MFAIDTSEEKYWGNTSNQKKLKKPKVSVPALQAVK